MAENTVMRVQTGQLGRRPTSTIFKILQEHSERLQKLYAEGTYKFISPLDDNLRLLVIVLALYPIVYEEFYIVAAEFVVATFSLLTTVKLSWYLLLCSFSVGKKSKRSSALRALKRPLSTMTTPVSLQKFNLGVLVSTCFTLKMLFTTV